MSNPAGYLRRWLLTFRLVFILFHASCLSCHAVTQRSLGILQSWTTQSFTLLYIFNRNWESLCSHLYYIGIWLCTTHSYLPRYKLWWDSISVSITSIIITMLNVLFNACTISRTHSQVDWNAQIFTTRWSRWGKKRPGPSMSLFDCLSSYVSSSEVPPT